VTVEYTRIEWAKDRLAKKVAETNDPVLYASFPRRNGKSTYVVTTAPPEAKAIGYWTEGTGRKYAIAWRPTWVWDDALHAYVTGSEAYIPEV
jgi:hypothetical protein